MAQKSLLNKFVDVVNKNPTKWMKILSLALIAFGALFLVMGINQQRELKRLESVCTEQADCVIARYVDESSDDRPRYYPVYEYEAGGRTYAQQSEKYRGDDRPREGSKLALYYNPENPDDYYVPDEKGGGNNMGLIIFAGVLLGLGALMLLRAFKTGGKKVDYY
jgi:hypothetical protein